MRSQRAKVLHEAGGMPVLEHVIRAAKALTDPERITVVVGHQAEAVQASVAHHGIRFALQAEQHGTGHALLCAAGTAASADGLLVVLYGDCPLLRVETLQRLVKLQAESDSAGTVITTHVPDPTGYGRIVRGAGQSIVAIVEQKAASPEQLAITEINSGIYCFDAALLWPALRGLQPNSASGEVYLTDLVERYYQQHRPMVPLVLNDATELLGINTRVELATADRILRDRKTLALMLAGVTIERPETVQIDPDVEVGMDTVIGPFVHLRGTTRIGQACRIEAGSILQHARLGNNVHVQPYTVIADSVLDDQVSVGPFARLRNGNHLAANAHVGNFVELKKTQLGAGSKCGHLTYLGDAVVGSGVNIGAGTITCNYDGRNKHQTTIGDGTFIGSDSILVAPVTIGAGSTTAAGSVITDDVPAQALALGRARQVVKENWQPKG